MTGPSRIVASIVAVVLLGGAAAAFAVVWRPAIAAVEPPGPQAFDAALVKRGRELAAIGNCNNCHTVQGARNFAGGLPVPTTARFGSSECSSGSTVIRRAPG